MDHAEMLAKALIEVVLPGSRMVYRSDQSRSVHDFDLHHADGRTCAVEVTAAVDEIAEQTSAAIFDQKKGGPAVKTTLCKKDWHINPESGARINKIRENIDEYLAAVESDGIEGFFGPTDRWRYPSVECIYRDLGVFSGEVMHWEEPGYIRISPPGGGGAVGPQLVLDAVGREALKNDNRGKLGAAGTDQRYLLVYVHQGNYIVWCALTDFEPPPELPNVPPEITDVWAFSETRSEHECVVWRAGVLSPWQSLRQAIVTPST